MEGGSSQDWEAPALVLSAAPFGEIDCLVHVLTAEQGLVHGLARGGAARRNAATWQTGTLVYLRCRTRSSGQLGIMSGEVIDGLAAKVIHSRLALACLSSVCAVADAALPEGEPHAPLFSDTLAVLSALPRATGSAAMLPNLLRWERAVLSDLGFALDLSCCAVTGQTTGLVYVSPKTGRAVSVEGAGVWASRLLPLPELFMDDDACGSPEDWRKGLRLTGYFLRRDVLAPLHRPLPQARVRLETEIHDTDRQADRDCDGVNTADAPER